MRSKLQFFLFLCVSFLPPAYAEGPARLVFQAYSHGDLVYSLSLDSGGRIDVEAIVGQESNIARYSGTAMIDPQVFDALFNLLEDVENQPDEAFQSRQIDAIVILDYLDESGGKTVPLAGMSPQRRRLLLDLFSVIHTFASDQRIDFFGGDLELIAANRHQQILRYHRLTVGLSGFIVIVLVLATFIVCRRRGA